MKILFTIVKYSLMISTVFFILSSNLLQLEDDFMVHLKEIVKNLFYLYTILLILSYKKEKNKTKL